jgi:hypothetical protein
MSFHGLPTQHLKSDETGGLGVVKECSCSRTVVVVRPVVVRLLGEWDEYAQAYLLRNGRGVEVID